MTTHEERQSILDEEHLKLLSIGYYVLGGMHALFSLLPLIYVPIGLLVASQAKHGHAGNEPDARIVGVLFIVIGVALFLFLALCGALQIYVGRCIHQRKSPTLCRVVAAFTCFSIPLGTLLGVFTFLVLGRDSVSRAFGPLLLDRFPRAAPPPAP